MSNRGPSIVASPVLVGTITVIVTTIAIFVSYNANVGLPFVPTYNVEATVPDAVGLTRGNEVRMGGKRVGVVREIEAVTGDGGRPVARLALQLEKVVEPIKDDATVIVRPRSPLGLKYLELTRGDRGRPVPQGGSLPTAAGLPTVELDEVIDALDEPVRKDLKSVLVDLGGGTAGRGADFNHALARMPEFLARVESVSRNLAASETALPRLLDGLDATLAEVAPVAPALGRVVANAATTADALAGVAPDLEAVLVEAPPTIESGIRGLAVARPVLADAAVLLRELREGTPYVRPATTGLHHALEVGIPALRRTTGLAGRLEDTLGAVERLAEDPATVRTLDRLRQTLDAATPTLEFIAPLQTRCNYLALWFRNLSSVLGEGDASGNWFRTLVISNTEEFRPSAKPSPNLHVNPYPRTAAPGQEGECESGNEEYERGQLIGNPPGVQATATEQTEPPAEVRGKEPPLP